MSTLLKGQAWVYGDNVDTDVIIPARYLTTSDPKELAPHCMEDIDKDFASSVKKGDILVAGSNFGCGSSREHAPLAILGAGVSCVVASSFARIFYRNSINVGLPIFESAEAVAAMQNGDTLEIDLSTGAIKNITKGTHYQANAFPPFLQELVTSGGLVPYVKKRLAEEK